MVGMNHCSTKAALRATVTEHDIPDVLLGNSFPEKRYTERPDQDIEDYQATFLQTQKHNMFLMQKTSPMDFFKSSYKLASDQVIKIG